MTNHLKTSIVVPSKGGYYLKYLLTALKNQHVRAYEVILIIKDCNLKAVEQLCKDNDLNSIIIEQHDGYFTQALNIGKKVASGDILIFTDDDAIPPKKWIETYVQLHIKYARIACFCSRDIYIDLETMYLLPTPDDRPIVRTYRWLVRSWLEQAHPLLKKYRRGIYLTKNLEIAHGHCIPYKACYSLPFRGVNMSFKQDCIHDAFFPEHPELKRGFGCEQYFGLQLALKGYDMVYVPHNPVQHIIRNSLSRTSEKKVLIHERYITKMLMQVLLNNYSCN